MIRNSTDTSRSWVLASPGSLHPPPSSPLALSFRSAAPRYGFFANHITLFSFHFPQARHIASSSLLGPEFTLTTFYHDFSFRCLAGGYNLHSSQVGEAADMVGFRIQDSSGNFYCFFSFGQRRKKEERAQRSTTEGGGRGSGEPMNFYDDTSRCLRK